MQVDAEDVLPVLPYRVGIGGESVAPRDAGIVDQDGDGTDFIGDLFGHRDAILMLGHIERETLRLAAGGFDVGGGLFRGFAVDVEHRDCGTLTRIAKCDAAADAGARTGDGGDMVGKEIGHCFILPEFYEG